jgi:23S rRNA pseudouridine2605 synthase
MDSGDIMQERLQKYLAECGIASRRKCEELIKQGLITVNGSVVTDMGVKINPEKDFVKYRNKVVRRTEDKLYIMLNKPSGYVTTTSEQFNRPKVTDLIKGVKYRLYPVGRLDYDSSGLLLLTNDGEMTYKLTHPSHQVDKKYIVRVKGMPDENSLEILRTGVKLDDFTTSPALARVIDSESKNAVLEITIHEGKNRQIRRMCSSIGHEVISLKRVSTGKIRLGDLKEGQWRYLTAEETDYLKKI